MDSRFICVVDSRLSSIRDMAKKITRIGISKARKFVFNREEWKPNNCKTRVRVRTHNTHTAHAYIVSSLQSVQLSEKKAAIRVLYCGADRRKLYPPAPANSVTIDVRTFSYAPVFSIVDEKIENFKN